MTSVDSLPLGRSSDDVQFLIQVPSTSRLTVPVPDAVPTLNTVKLTFVPESECRMTWPASLSSSSTLTSSPGMSASTNIAGLLGRVVVARLVV